MASPWRKNCQGPDMPPENAEMPFIAPITRRSPRDSRLPMRAVTSWAAERLPLTPFHPYHYPVPSKLSPAIAAKVQPAQTCELG